MIGLTLADLAATLGGELVLGGNHEPTTVVSGDVHTDSRKVTPGAIFFALPGEVTDGHLFAPAAIENGAALLIVERALDVPVSQVVVADGVAALAALAREVVTRVRSGGTLKVVAVTGSNGKTTTKNMLRTILEAEGPTVSPF
jgi:UDP-N-acetylmuramoyl-tripeptide--D-alanyl-D-alanine ligase